MANGTNQERSSPGLYTLLGQIADGLSTRLQIASIELSVARDNAGKAAFYGILAGFFGLLCLLSPTACKMPTKILYITVKTASF